MISPRPLLLNILVLLVSSGPAAESANILILDPLATHSHAIWFNVLSGILVKNGHQVTVLSTDPEKQPLPNRTTYTLENSYEGSEYDGIDLGNIKTFWSGGATQSYKDMWDWDLMNCDQQKKSNGLKRFMAEFVQRAPKVDLIIRDGAGSECFLGLVHLLKNPPVISATPFPNYEPTGVFVGNYDNPAYVPHALSGYSDRMNFWQRAHNIYIGLYFSLMRRYYYLPKADRISREMFGTDAPHVQYLDDQIQLSFVNYHPVLDYAKPLVPALIPVPGLQLKEPAPLPQDIQSFLDGAKDGAIVFTFGSSYLTKNMSPKYRAMFFDVFAGMKQRVIWKWELEIPADKPDNVMLARWLPQSDILGHHHTVAFISHCGQAGTQEAIYHAVPVLAIPFILDQNILAHKLEGRGAAVVMEYDELTAPRVRAALDKLIQPQYGYKQRMARLSEAFRDTPEKSSDKIVFWVNYILKHGGAHLIPVSKRLSVIQYYLLDVAAYVVFTPIALFYLTRGMFWLVKR